MLPAISAPARGRRRRPRYSRRGALPRRGWRGIVIVVILDYSSLLRMAVAVAVAVGAAP